MSGIGIVAEYNPFHTGHAHQISESRRLLGGNLPVVAVMSGNWVQGADCALADKWARTRLALLGGVDLVLELPTVWAVSSAESFARVAMSLLAASGVVDTLSFGSECGDTEALRQAAACLDSPAYQTAVGRLANSGLPFAQCRQKAAETLLGPEQAALLSPPNNNLGVEYLRSLAALGSPIRPITVRREGTGHNRLSVPGERPRFTSATQIRNSLRAGDLSGASPWLLPGEAELLAQAPLALLNRAERAILARLRTLSAGDWALLPDSGAAEGLPSRLERAGLQCRSLEEFYALAKTRRFSHARLRRLVLWAYLGLTAADRPDTPPYLRVLGFNQRGRTLLKEMKTRSALPILTKPAHAKGLDGTCRRLFEREVRCTDLYDLCREEIPISGREWTTNPVILA